MTELKKIYDQCYSGCYRENLSGFEVARWKALQHFISKFITVKKTLRILDYGAGSGLHVPLWVDLFQNLDLYFFDISSVAKDKFSSKYPEYSNNYLLESDLFTTSYDNFFDVIVSIEVMEHVEDLLFYLQNIRRMLKPGGVFIWTTPCANNFSIEHLIAILTRKIDKTNEGYRRWRWEDPTHLRRLKSKEVQSLLKTYEFEKVIFRFRSHLFSYLCTYCLPHRFLNSLKNYLMSMDYSLFRRLPNGASMIGSAKKSVNMQ
jgi:2-polyprenyl-3-methyl-5-hydroxy-6-metoxy-1,4-benzoquinol methylase